MHHQAAPMLRGLAAVMRLVSAEQGIIGIKNKYTAVQEALAPQLPASVRILPLSDTYPAGDEFLLVYDAIGRVIPPGGLPKDVGAVVVNVETLVNIGVDRPVTHKYLTVAGAVRTPVTLRAPVGMRIGDLIEAAGGATERRCRRCCSAASMMGRLAASLDEPVTKTLGGVVVLPVSHPLSRGIARAGARSSASAARRATSAASARNCVRATCSGIPIRAARARCARSASTSPQLADDRRARCIAASATCAACTSCPENLDPKNVCTFSKPLARERNLQWKGNPADVEPHPLAGFAARADEAADREARAGAASTTSARSTTASLAPRARRPAAQAARRRAGRSRVQRRARASRRATWSPRRRPRRSAPGCTPASPASCERSTRPSSSKLTADSGYQISGTNDGTWVERKAAWRH